MPEHYLTRTDERKLSYGSVDPILDYGRFMGSYQPTRRFDDVPTVVWREDSPATSKPRSLQLSGSGMVVRLYSHDVVMKIEGRQHAVLLLIDLVDWRAEDTQDGLVDRQSHIRKRLELALHAVFEVDSVEDGISHPAEKIIADALAASHEDQVLDWFREFSLDADQPGFAASFLRCLGRLSNPGTEEWRVDLVRRAMRADSVQVRDAAVQAADRWADAGMIDVLKDHKDPQRWLTDYIEMVVVDIATQ